MAKRRQARRESLTERNVRLLDRMFRRLDPEQIEEMIAVVLAAGTLLPGEAEFWTEVRSIYCPKYCQ